MTSGNRAPKVAVLTRGEQLIFRLLFQSKVRLTIFSVLILAPLAASSGIALWFYHQNQALVSSTQEVVGELEVLDQEIEVLSRRAGIPRVRSDGKTAEGLTQQIKGQGGVPVKVPPHKQLEFAKSKLPALNQKLEQETKPALEKTLKREAVVSQATPTGNPVQGHFMVSSDFGIRPNPYGGGGYEGHDGIDILGDLGTPIYATISGKAERAGYDGGYGNHVVIKSSQGFETLYGHLSEVAVAPNTQVKQGQLIGYMGNTGRSTGTHLHYAIYRNGKALDPKPYMVPSWKYYAEAFH